MTDQNTTTSEQTLEQRNNSLRAERRALTDMLGSQAAERIIAKATLASTQHVVGHIEPDAGNYLEVMQNHLIAKLGDIIATLELELELDED